MQHSTVIVLGSVNTDLVIKSPRLPQPGETVLGGRFYQSDGGKGANQAVAAARTCSSPVTFIAAVGDDEFGRASQQAFARENLDCRHVRVIPGQPTGVALILVDEAGENVISVASGANLHLTPEDIDAIPDDVFHHARVFLACLESPLETAAAGLTRARQAGLTTILNPAPASPAILDSGILEFVDVLTPNESETGILTGMPTSTAAETERAARQLRSRGCPRVVVTRGHQGLFVADGDRTKFVDAFRVDAHDTTAAGDAFNGALAAALAEEQPLTGACRFASAAAALSVTRHGAQPSLPTREEIRRFLDAH